MSIDDFLRSKTFSDVRKSSLAPAPVEPPPVEEPGLIETGLRGVARGTLGIFSGVGSAAEWAGDVSGSQGLRGFGTTLQDLANDEIQTGVGALNGPSFEGSFTENPSLKRTVGVVAQAVPSLGLAVATGGTASVGLQAAGLGLRAAQIGGAATAATGLGVLEGAPQYSEARQAGKSVGEASAVGSAATVGTALLEYLPIGKILGEASKGAVRTGLTGAVTEGLQEGTQTVWQNLVAKLGYDQSRSLAEGMVESMVGGAGAGGVVGGITGHVQQKRDTVTSRTLEKLMPEGAQVSVDSGMATVQAAGRSFQAPVQTVATALAAGVSFDDLADAHTTLLDEVTSYIDAQQRQTTAPAVAQAEEVAQAQEDTTTAVQPPIDMERYARDLEQRNAAVQAKTFESLQQARSKPQFVGATEQGLTYTEQGAPVTYTPLEGQTVVQLQEKIAGMPDAQAVAYLKQNASLVQQEEPTFSRKVTDIKGNKVEAPTVFYRGEREGGDRSVSGNAVWDSLLFASSDKSGADLYAGSAGTVTELRAKPETKILYEGTKEFRSLNKGNTFGGPKGKNLLDWAAETAYRAKEQGYDAVWFKRQSDVGTAIINRSAFEGEADLNFLRENIPQSPATLGTEIDTPEIQALSKGIGDYLNTRIAPGTFAQAETPEAMKRLTPLLETRLGKKIVYFTAKDAPMQIAGVTGIADDTIYINADTKTPHLAVVGHEFLHELKRADKAEYEGILQAVQKLMPQEQFAAMQASLDSARSAEGKGTTSQTLVHEELTADYFGEQFMTKQFWEKAQRNHPQQFVSLAQRFVQFVQKVKDTFTGKQLTDIEKAQDVAVAAMRKYAKKNGLENDPRFMMAWHGSPHDHNKFDSSKIGTGEGAQAYGWGLYFAGKKEVAEFYRDTLSKQSSDPLSVRIRINGKPIGELLADRFRRPWDAKIKVAIDGSGGNLDAAIDSLKTQLENQEHISGPNEATRSKYAEMYSFLEDLKNETVEVVEPESGRLYEVELAPNEDEYLLWDKPLSEQSAKVKAVLVSNKVVGNIKVVKAYGSSFDLEENGNPLPGRAYSSEAEAKEYRDKIINNRLNNYFGKSFYFQTSSKVGGDKPASRYLHSLGIRGIKYLDGSSRSQGEGSHNYVIFSDEDVSIKAKFSRMDEAGATTDTQRAEARRLWHEKGTDSPYFKKWFGDSKVVDENGKPLMVYHGTDNKFDVFDTSDKSLDFEVAHALGENIGSFFAAKENDAEDFGRNVQGFYVSLKNPKVFKDQNEFRAFMRENSGRTPDIRDADGYIVQEGVFENNMRSALETAGHDGVVIKNPQYSAKKDKPWVVAFSPSQIKSATGNRGTFDATNPDITFSRMDAALKQGQQQLVSAGKAALNPKDTLHKLAVEHAPKWLSVMPLQTEVKLFEKTVPQIKSIYDRLNQTVTIKNDLIDVAYVLRDEAHKLATKTVGVDTFNKAAELGTFNRMLPWEDIYAQEWVPATGTKQQRLQKAQEAWVAAGMQKATKLTFVQAYAESREAYDALKHDELKQAYKSAVDYMKNIRNRERDNLLAYIESVSDEGTALRKQLMQRFEASFSDIQGAYWPLSRFGDFTLSYTDTNGFRIFKTFPTYADALQVQEALIAGGEVEAGNINVSRKDAKTAAESGIPNALMSQLQSAVQAKYTEGINAEDEVAYDNALLRAQSTVQEMNQIWLRWQPETSALKNSMRRGNVKGYDPDMLRGFLNYVQHHASRIAWSEQGRKIEQDMQEMAAEVSERGKGEGATNTALQQAILNDMRLRLQTLKTAKVGWAASSLGKLGTAYFMTSPSIALVQMSQLAVLTLPKLATMYSVKGATTALSKGTVQALSQQYSRDAMFADADVNRLYDMMREAVSQQTRQDGQRIGEPRYTQAHIKAEIAKLTPEQQRLLALREAMARNLLDISATHEAYELTQGKNPDSPLRKAFYYAMAPMRLSELASRKTAVLATFELATEQGKDFFGAMNDIADVVNDTLYSYAKENKGWRMQGGLARVLLMFRHYQIMTGIRMIMLFKDSIKGETAEVRSLARREFVGIMGMTGLLAGSLGLPLSQTIFAILDMVLGDDDEPMDSKLEFTNWLDATLGETAGNVAAKGLPTLVGMDLSRRIGLQDIYGMGQDAPAQLHGSSLAAWHAAHMLGPSYSVFEGWFKGYDQMMNKGNYLRGLEEATPKPIRDMLKAYRTATEGVKTTSGKRLVADEDMGVDEIISMALGFYPDELATAQANQSALLKMSTRISERRGKLIRQAASAIMEGGDPMEAYEGIRTFNSKMPRFKIGSGDVRSAIKSKQKGELGTTGVRERAVAQQYGIDALGVE